MSRLIQTLILPTERQKKWHSIAFVSAILAITALGFLVDGYEDSINSTNIL
ncbi:hypothetical protein MAQ5080_00648 [Marinomonas aquimarina]|uniref:Uncharacterized protein n=1 Tax=Marinomonas aquimarina TaxID=295068 RepID=A0A1A8T3V8_9GAMM|nr:hypothetical protein MAQ5080_00648 [Marinomonas aquimarina]